mmetsp:Transcript_63382/g.166007  ORF Transcript_63382/g.166007 Transcript_63382/m.166007 type:complete len:229 (-) Transcript_63382:2046-2732(-)
MREGVRSTSPNVRVGSKGATPRYLTPPASARLRNRLKPLLCRPEEGRPMMTSPAFILLRWGRGSDCSMTPTTKPETSAPLAVKMPGISAVLEPSMAQPASTQPSARPWLISRACCASSLGEARWPIMKRGSAPRAATSFTRSATRSTPTVPNLSMAIATFSLVPTLLVLLTSIPLLCLFAERLQRPARPEAPPSSMRISQPARAVRAMSGAMLFMIVCSMEMSTPAPR